MTMTYKLRYLHYCHRLSIRRSSLEQAGFHLSKHSIIVIAVSLLGIFLHKLNQLRLIAGTLLSVRSTYDGSVSSYESLPLYALIISHLSQIAKRQSTTFAIGGSSGFAFGPHLPALSPSSGCTWPSSFHRSWYYYIYRSIPAHATYHSSCPNYRPSQPPKIQHAATQPLKIIETFWHIVHHYSKPTVNFRVTYPCILDSRTGTSPNNSFNNRTLASASLWPTSAAYWR